MAELCSKCHRISLGNTAKTIRFNNQNEPKNPLAQCKQAHFANQLTAFHITIDGKLNSNRHPLKLFCCIFLNLLQRSLSVFNGTHKNSKLTF